MSISPTLGVCALIGAVVGVVLYSRAWVLRDERGSYLHNAWLPGVLIGAFVGTFALGGVVALILSAF